jgi:hypothetical protein
VTLAQLQSLHLGARRGLRAPTLAGFMAALRAAGCRRPLVVEIKRLQTDAARERLLLLLRWVGLWVLGWVGEQLLLLLRWGLWVGGWAGSGQVAMSVVGCAVCGAALFGGGVCRMFLCAP